MLCSAAELNLAESSEGILVLPGDAPVGQEITDYLKFDDQIIEVDLTPNRGDCLGVCGVAREVSAINNAELSAPQHSEVSPVIEERFPVELLAPEACPRFVGRIIRNINPQATTPLWMREKLRRCGLRPISPVVDITNYVMMELGQPMHGFDFDKLEGGIRVRMAKAGEKIGLLDQSEVECDDTTLVIADHEKALAMAGIMGGMHSAVQSDTTNIFFEAAHFINVKIAGKARSYGMHTDASHRFERGVDPQLPRKAMERATGLLIAIAGGEAGPVIEVVDQDHLPKQSQVHLRHSRIKRLLGVDVSNSGKHLDIELQDVIEEELVDPDRGHEGQP